MKVNVMVLDSHNILISVMGGDDVVVDVIYYTTAKKQEPTMK